MTSNKRIFSRIPLEVDAELTVADTSFRVQAISNLSVGGCLLPIRANVAPGSACRVRIRPDGPENGFLIEVFGEIKRSDPGTVAVQFTRIDPDSLFHLRNIVRHNCPDADAVDREIRSHPGIR